MYYTLKRSYRRNILDWKKIFGIRTWRSQFDWGELMPYSSLDDAKAIPFLYYLSISSCIVIIMRLTLEKFASTQQHTQETAPLSSPILHQQSSCNMKTSSRAKVQRWANTFCIRHSSALKKRLFQHSTGDSKLCVMQCVHCTQHSKQLNLNLVQNRSFFLSHCKRRKKTTWNTQSQHEHCMRLWTFSLWYEQILGALTRRHTNDFLEPKKEKQTNKQKYNDSRYWINGMPARFEWAHTLCISHCIMNIKHSDAPTSIRFVRWNNRIVYCMETVLQTNKLNAIRIDSSFVVNL